MSLFTGKNLLFVKLPRSRLYCVCTLIILYDSNKPSYHALFVRYVQNASDKILAFYKKSDNMRKAHTSHIPDEPCKSVNIGIVNISAVFML